MARRFHPPPKTIQHSQKALLNTVPPPRWLAANMSAYGGEVEFDQLVGGYSALSLGGGVVDRNLPKKRLFWASFALDAGVPSALGPWPCGLVT